MRTKVYSYAPSNGASALAKGLGIKVIKHEKSKYIPRVDDTIINWGSSNIPRHLYKCKRIINNPTTVALVSNKLLFFHEVFNKGLSIPEWTEDPAVVKMWIDKGKTVFARTVLNGHSGKGIVELKKGVDICKASLYTVYIPKKEEYRVHIVAGNVIHTQRKALRNDYNGPKNWTIRSHANGFKFVYGKDLGKVPDDVLQQARRAMEICRLDFGAVDIIWNDKEKKAYVLEINTAPGLEGTTVQKYTEALKGLL
jgi:glutathione synthase/RimK-type ligase-like ATP-grasp enzyme